MAVTAAARTGSVPPASRRLEGVTRPRHPTLPCLLAVLVLMGCSRAPDTGGGALVGSLPPSIEADGVVASGASPPTDWAALAGNVVFLEFGFLR